MSITRVQQNYGLAISGGGTLAFPSNVAAGNLLVVSMFHSYLGCPPSCTDSQGNTYTARVSGTSIGLVYWWVFTATAGASAANTVTLAMGCGSAQFCAITELSGHDTTTPFGGTNTSTNAANPVQAGSVTTTVNGSYVLAMFKEGGGTSYTQGSGFTERYDSAGWYLEDQVQTTAGAINPDATAAANASNVVGASLWIKATAGGGGGGVVGRPWIYG